MVPKTKRIIFTVEAEMPADWSFAECIQHFTEIKADAAQCNHDLWIDALSGKEWSHNQAARVAAIEVYRSNDRILKSLHVQSVGSEERVVQHDGREVGGNT